MEDVRVTYLPTYTFPQATPSPLNFPPHISTTSPLPISAASKEMLQQQKKAMKKKASASVRPSPLPKGSEENRLFSLHKDVGQNNSQLFEPQTPEFKPSPEWVREGGRRERGREVFLALCDDN